MSEKKAKEQTHSETEHLLSSDKNAERLNQSIKEVKSKKGPRLLFKDDDIDKVFNTKD